MTGPRPSVGSAEETSRTCLKCLNSFMSNLPKSEKRICPTCERSNKRIVGNSHEPRSKVVLGSKTNLPT